jgi:hypothetical protein
MKSYKSDYIAIVLIVLAALSYFGAGPGGGGKVADLMCVVVEESKTRTISQATVILDAKARAAFPGGFRLVDKDSDEPAMLPFIAQAGTTLPVVILVSAAKPSSTLFKGPLPPTPAELEALAAKWRAGP